MEDKQTYNIKEAAKILGIGEVTVRRRVKDKTLDATYVSKKLGYQITKESIDKLAAERATKRKAKQAQHKQCRRRSKTFFVQLS